MTDYWLVKNTLFLCYFPLKFLFASIIGVFLSLHQELLRCLHVIAMLSCGPYSSDRWPQTWDSWGFLWTWKTYEIVRDFCETLRKNSNRHLSCVLVTWSECGGNLLNCWNDPWWRSLFVFQLLFVVITYGKVSLWLWKSLENSGIFPPTLWSQLFVDSVWWVEFMPL